MTGSLSAENLNTESDTQKVKTSGYFTTFSQTFIVILEIGIQKYFKAFYNPINTTIQKSLWPYAIFDKAEEPKYVFQCDKPMCLCHSSQ